MAIPTFTQGATPSIVDLVGDTPLIRLRRIERDLPGVELYAKAEWQNPGGSVKDRPALRMIQEGIASGQLVAGKVILDATSGNTGIAYAMMGAAMGFSVTLCVPENVTPERKRILRAYGAELVFTNPLEGSDGAIRMAQQMNESSPGKYFYADQYNNDVQLEIALRHDRARDHPPGRIAHHAFRRGPRHERHVHRRRPAPARIQPEYRAGVGAAGFAAARPRRPEAHGVRDRAGHLRSEARGRRRARRHRRGVRDDAPARAGRRTARRHLERREPRRRA